MCRLYTLPLKPCPKAIHGQAQTYLQSFSVTNQPILTYLQIALKTYKLSVDEYEPDTYKSVKERIKQHFTEGGNKIANVKLSNGNEVKMEISTLVAANNNNLFCTFLTHQSHDGGQRSGQGPEATRRTPVVLGISGHALHIIIALFFIFYYAIFYVLLYSISPSTHPRDQPEQIFFFNLVFVYSIFICIQ